MSPFRSLARHMVFRAVLISVALLSLPSCDSSGPDPEEELLGSWHWRNRSVNYYLTSDVHQLFPLINSPATGGMTVRGDVNAVLPHVKISTIYFNKNKSDGGGHWIRFTSFDPDLPEDPNSIRMELFIRINMYLMTINTGEVRLNIEYPDVSLNRTYSVNLQSPLGYHFSNGQLRIDPFLLRDGDTSVTVDGVINFETVPLAPGQRQRFDTYILRLTSSPDTLGAFHRLFMNQGVYQEERFSHYQGGDSQINNGTWVTNRDSIRIQFRQNDNLHTLKYLYEIKNDTLNILLRGKYCFDVECSRNYERLFGLAPGSLSYLESDDMMVHRRISRL